MIKGKKWKKETFFRFKSYFSCFYVGFSIVKAQLSQESVLFSAIRSDLACNIWGLKWFLSGLAPLKTSWGVNPKRAECGRLLYCSTAFSRKRWTWLKSSNCSRKRKSYFIRLFMASNTYVCVYNFFGFCSADSCFLFGL